MPSSHDHHQWLKVLWKGPISNLALSVLWTMMYILQGQPHSILAQYLTYGVFLSPCGSPFPWAARFKPTPYTLAGCCSFFWISHSCLCMYLSQYWDWTQAVPAILLLLRACLENGRLRNPRHIWREDRCGEPTTLSAGVAIALTAHWCSWWACPSCVPLWAA